MITACVICFFFAASRAASGPKIYNKRLSSGCRLRSVDRSNYDGPTKNCSVAGVARKAYAHFQEFIAACRLLLCEVACHLLTAWPARRSAAVDVTCQSLPRPSSSSFRSAKPAADRFDRRPDRGCRLWRGGGDFRAALLRMMIDEPIRSDHRRAMVVVALR